MIPSDQLERVSDEAAALCRQVASIDLAKSACYVVPHSFLGWPESEHLWLTSNAWTHPALDIKLREVLRATDKWRGRGFAALMNDGRILTEGRFKATALHELAHWLLYPEWQVIEPSRLSDAGCHELHKEVLAMAALPIGELPSKEHDWDDYDWRIHGSQFARMCIHLLHRASVQGGASIDPVLLQFARRWGTCQYAPSTYIGAIGSEPRDRQEDPLRDIMRSPPPAEWERLWKTIESALKQEV